MNINALNGPLILATELPANPEWLNTDRGCSHDELKGKFILLDLWAYCCINWTHIISKPKRLEDKYP